MKLSNKITTLIFLIFIFGGFIINSIVPSKEFSEEENRVLQQRPEFSFEDLESGKYTADFDNYVMDQFVFRDFWVGIKSDLESLRGMRENNDVFNAKDDYLLQAYKKVDSELLDKNIESVNGLKESNSDIPVNLMVVPTATEVLSEKLPYGAPNYSQEYVLQYIRKKLNEDINFVDSKSVLDEHRDEEIYYRTDHHWTSLGAYYGYNAASKSMGFKPYALDDFERRILSDKFYGTLYSKFNNKRVEPDKVEAFRLKNNLKHSLYYVDEDQRYDGLYREEFLEKKDKYSVFLGGNHSEVEITTDIKDGNKSDKKLLVIKDSYGHSMVPFLANHYEEIDMIDLRYYKKDINKYIDENHIDEVLVIYNADNFTTDNFIKRLS
ncbi:MAG: DHHW family protein [Clostridium sp.]